MRISQTSPSSYLSFTASSQANLPREGLADEQLDEALRRGFRGLAEATVPFPALRPVATPRAAFCRQFVLSLTHQSGLLSSVASGSMLLVV